ncbi:Rv3235 family protein [Krasilnikovia sp. MM14-A1004]|uniref:Rv3235 family protein n=1 Tax=Krasilnikovia sp. MM14-A1004 TaxID=3373541 RepID=UPI00399CD262
MPPCDPPFDDELDASVWAPAHQPAFRWPDHPAPTAAGPADNTRGEATSGVAGSNGVAATGAGPAAAVSGIAAGAVARGVSGEARAAVHRFVSAFVEVLNGYRPAAHLRRLTLPAQAARVVAQAVTGVHRVAELRRAGSRRTTDRHGRGAAPAAVLRLRLCEPRPGAVEATVLLVTGGRTWALALRLELDDQTWLATTVQLV